MARNECLSSRETPVDSAHPNSIIYGFDSEQTKDTSIQ